VKQVLQFPQKRNNTTSTKIENFNHLIVNVADNIYDALDAYFADCKVEVDQTEAQRHVSISKLPKCLLIHVNVLLEIDLLK
jgi:hypothetical protein